MALGQGRAPGELNRGRGMGGLGLKKTGPSGLEEKAFGEALDFEIDPRILEAGELLASDQPTFEFDPELRREFFQTAITDPNMRLFEEQIAPQIAERFGAAGFERSGLFGDALSNAGRDLVSNIAGLQSGFLREDEQQAFQAAESARNRVGEGAGLLGQSQLLPIQLRLGAGAQERGIEAANNAIGTFGNLFGHQSNNLDQLSQALMNLGSATPFTYTGA